MIPGVFRHKVILASEGEWSQLWLHETRIIRREYTQQRESQIGVEN